MVRYWPLSEGLLSCRQEFPVSSSSVVCPLGLSYDPCSSEPVVSGVSVYV